MLAGRFTYSFSRDFSDCLFKTDVFERRKHSRECKQQTSVDNILTPTTAVISFIVCLLANWNVSMVDIHLRKLLWVYCPGHAGVKGNDRTDRLAGKATLTNGSLLGRSEVLRSLCNYLRAQSQGHHTMDHMAERGMESGSSRRS